MHEINPYAAPPIVAEQVPHPSKLAFENMGLWRQGNLLVVRKGAPLPPLCVKSNQPTTRYLKRNLTWVPWWVYLTIFINLLVLLIVALIMQKKATVHIGLSDEWFAIRRKHMLIAWGLAGLAVLMFVAGIAIVESAEEVGVLCMVLTPFAIIGAAIYGLVMARMVAPKKIDDHFVWLKGVCPE